MSLIKHGNGIKCKECLCMCNLFYFFVKYFLLLSFPSGRVFDRLLLSHISIQFNIQLRCNKINHKTNEIIA